MVRAENYSFSACLGESLWEWVTQNWCVRIYPLNVGIEILPPAIKGTGSSELFLKTLLLW